MVSFPALIKSASYSPSFGYGPTPMIPFSDYKTISISLFKYDGIKVGIPIPKFTYIPWLIS